MVVVRATNVLPLCQAFVLYKVYYESELIGCKCQETSSNQLEWKENLVASVTGKATFRLAAGAMDLRAQ